MRSTIYDSDQKLFKALKAGDTIACKIIFERYKSILYQHAYRMLGNHDEAQDVVQDVFLNLWQKRVQLDVKSSLSSYMYQAVRNRILNLISHQQVIDRYSESLKAFWKEGEYTTDHELREKELIAVIQREINTLPPKMRRIYLLSRRDDISYRQIAEREGISEKTVRNQVYNALQVLKSRISSFLTVS